MKTDNEHFMIDIIKIKFYHIIIKYYLYFLKNIFKLLIINYNASFTVYNGSTNKIMTYIINYYSQFSIVRNLFCNSEGITPISIRFKY